MKIQHYGHLSLKDTIKDINEMSNPFNITKAVDYTDEELYNYWVDFPNVGFREVIKPTSEVPMIILGSKGSGKTHIMKHFSYTMQCFRNTNNLLKGITKEGYLGTYLRCSGLNGNRFSARGETIETWETFFSYYLELWLGQLILNNMLKFLLDTELKYSESDIVEGVLELFDYQDDKVEISNIKELIKYLSSLQKEIDFAINNKALTKKSISENVNVLLSPGSLIFGIPKVLASKIDEFKSLKFLYLLDEYENFTKSQQKYFNTLIRERENPTCFKIGARRYGIKTLETLSDKEEIKRGSEYEEFDIDLIFRNDSYNYKEFIKEICFKRLENSRITFEREMFESYFEQPNLEKFFKDIESKKRLHLNKLEKKLKYSNYDKDKRKIISNIKFKKDIILERTNILLLYRYWKKGEDLVLASEKIKKSSLEFFKDNRKKDNEHSRVLDKYKNDIVDALYRENKLKIKSYIGFNNLIRISNGIPRHFLIIMKHVYRWNEFFGKKIFTSKDHVIDAKSQLYALSDTTSWFIEDARIPGDNGNKIKDCIERLCDYLRELRFSDIPPECSISTFSINLKVIPKEISDIIEYLEKYTYITKINTGRRDKNLNNRNQTYQINGLLAFEWELSLVRRGVVSFDSQETMFIFLPEDDSDYKKKRNQRLSRYNAPFSFKTNLPSLFD